MKLIMHGDGKQTMDTSALKEVVMGQLEMQLMLGGQPEEGEEADFIQALVTDVVESLRHQGWEIRSGAVDHCLPLPEGLELPGTIADSLIDFAGEEIGDKTAEEVLRHLIEELGKTGPPIDGLAPVKGSIPTFVLDHLNLRSGIGSKELGELFGLTRPTFMNRCAGKGTIKLEHWGRTAEMLLKHIQEQQNRAALEMLGKDAVEDLGIDPALIGGSD